MLVNFIGSVFSRYMGIFESIATDVRVELPQLDRSHSLDKWLKQTTVSYPKLTNRDYKSWLDFEDKRLESKR
tara:strand:- start:94 stop:309 length:216 start_codon:yes stop_codon:yes gene_type:complete